MLFCCYLHQCVPLTNMVKTVNKTAQCFVKKLLMNQNVTLVRESATTASTITIHQNRPNVITLQVISVL